MSTKLYLLSSAPQVSSRYVSTIREKVRQLDARANERALAVLDGLADHFLEDDRTVATLSKAERLEQAIARMRACGARQCVAFLERQREGTHG